MSTEPKLGEPGYKGHPGNQFWKMRSSHGRKPAFADPEQLWNACIEYFEWVDANPLLEARPFAYEGKVHLEQIPKMRAMTINGLCIFLDIATQTWQEYRARAGFEDTCAKVDAIIRTQKFEGAAAELLNQNIIARELGLADKSEVTGADGGPVIFKTIYERAADD